MQNAFWQKWAVIATKFIWVSKCLFVHMMHHCVGTLCNWKEWLWTCDTILRFQFSKIGIWLGRMKLKSNYITFIIRMMDPWISSDIKRLKHFRALFSCFLGAYFYYSLLRPTKARQTSIYLICSQVYFNFAPEFPGQ